MKSANYFLLLVFVMPFINLMAGPLVSFQVNQPLYSHNIHFGYNICYSNGRAPYQTVACEEGTRVPNQVIQHWRDAKYFQWSAAGRGFIATMNGKPIYTEGCDPIADAWPTHGSYLVTLQYYSGAQVLRCNIIK